MIFWSKTFHCFCHWRLNHLIIFCLYAGHTMNHLCHFGISVYSIFTFATVIFQWAKQCADIIDTIQAHTCTPLYIHNFIQNSFYMSCYGCCCALRSFLFRRRLRLFDAAHSFLMARPCKVSASFYFERLLRKIVNRVTSVAQPIRNHRPLNNFLSA